MKGLHTQGLFESLLATTDTDPGSSVEVVEVPLCPFLCVPLPLSPCSSSAWKSRKNKILGRLHLQSSEKQAGDMVMWWLPILTSILDSQDPP